MQLVTQKRCIGAMILGAGLILAGCGTGSASHVVGLTPVSPGSVGESSTPASTPPSSSGLAAPSPGASAAGPAGLSASTLSQVDAELSAVDNSLNQSNTDLNFNPQGDS